MTLRALLLVLLAAGCGPSRQEAPFEEALLAVLPEDANVLVPVAFSRDGHRAAYVARQAAGDDVVSCLEKGSPVGRVC